MLGFVPSAVPKSRAVGWLRQSCLRWVPSSGAAPTADSVASPDTRPPGDQHFYPVGTRQCLLSGLSCLMRSPGHTGRRETVYAVGDMGLTCGFSGRVSVEGSGRWVLLPPKHFRRCAYRGGVRPLAFVEVGDVTVPSEK